MFTKLLNIFKKNTAADTAPEKPATRKISAAPESSTATSKSPSAREQAQQQLQQLTHGQAIAAIHDSELLGQLLKLSPHLDKHTNREVRERLQQLKTQHKLQQARAEQQQRICERLETLARINHHPLFDSEFTHLQQQWQQQTEHDSEELAERVTRALLACVEIQRQAELQQLAEQAAAEAQQQQQHAQLEQRQNASRAAAEHAAQLAASTESARELAQQNEQQRQEHVAKQQRLLQTALEQLTRLEAAITVSDSKKAHEIQERIRNNLKQLDKKYASQIDGKLHLLSGQLRELRDWQAFAALPKLEALCEEMEKLAELELPVTAKADAVRELQQQWRAAKPPQVKQAQALWDRFKAAGDRAWAPCAEHFDNERKQREFNLEQRQIICQSVESFAAQFTTERADWKALNQLLEQVHREFQRFHPVPRAEEKPIRQRYDDAIAPLKQALSEEMGRNEAAKQQLIARAQALAEHAGAADLVDRVKPLQEAWKQIGITRRNEDQKLWQAFKTATDSLFETRRQAREQQRAHHDQRVQEAQEVIQALRDMATADDDTLAGSAAAFAELEARFSEFKDLPEAQLSGLNKAFRAAGDNYRERVRGIPARREQAANQALWAAVNGQAAHLNEAQQALLAARPAPTPETDRQRRLLAIELEVLADRDSPDSERELRQQWQMQRLTQAGIGQASGAHQAEQVRTLFQRWIAEAPASGALETELAARVQPCLQALEILG